jgi:hypothetical protein
MTSFGIGKVPSRDPPPIHIEQLQKKHEADAADSIEIPPMATAATQATGIKGKVLTIDPRLASKDLLAECQKLNLDSSEMESALKQAEITLGNIQYFDKSTAVVSSLSSHFKGGIDSLRENVYYPLDLISTSMNLDAFVTKFANGLYNTELIFQGFRTLGRGAGLIYRKVCIQNAEHLKLVLEIGLKSKNLTPWERKNLQDNIRSLSDRIEQEKTALSEEAKSFGISTFGYLPRGVKTLWGVCAEIKPVVDITLGWAAPVCIAAAMYHDKSLAEEAVQVQGKWLSNFKNALVKSTQDNSADLRSLVEKRAAHDTQAPYQERRTILKLKQNLKELTKVKQESVQHLLAFSLESKKADLYVSSLLLVALAVIKTVLISVSLASFILFPYAGLVIVSFVLLGAAAHYWMTNRPNLFAEIVKTYFKSAYYSIRLAIDDWQLQSKKLNQIQQQATVVGAVAKLRFVGKTTKEEQTVIAKFSQQRKLLDTQLKELEGKVKFWKGKKTEIKERLLNAELADLNARTLSGKAPLKLQGILDSIIASMPYLGFSDKQELRDILNIDLTDIPSVNFDPNLIRERILDSFIGMDEAEMVAFLKAKG